MLNVLQSLHVCYLLAFCPVSAWSYRGYRGQFRVQRQAAWETVSCLLILCMAWHLTMASCQYLCRGLGEAFFSRKRGEINRAIAINIEFLFGTSSRYFATSR